MGSDSQPRRRRGTPISDGLGADLQALGTILASHTRGLDDYLQRQAQRIDERHDHLLAETTGFLLPQDLNLEALTNKELQALCRQKGLRGWSKLKRQELIAFLQEELGPELDAMQILRQEPITPTSSATADATVPPLDASRTERLLLLLLQHLGVPQADVDAAWRGPQTNHP